MSEPDKPWTWGDQPPQPAKHPLDLHPEGTRFLATGYDADMHAFAQGDWVRYSDYARLKAEVERLTNENETINKDRALLWASHKIALQDIQGLHYALQAAKGVQS